MISNAWQVHFPIFFLVFILRNKEIPRLVHRKTIKAEKLL